MTADSGCCSLLLQFSVSWGPRVLLVVQCTAVNIRFFLTVFKEGFENIFFHFADIRHKKKNLACRDLYMKLEPTGSD